MALIAALPIPDQSPASGNAMPVLNVRRGASAALIELIFTKGLMVSC